MTPKLIGKNVNVDREMVAPYRNYLQRHSSMTAIGAISEGGAAEVQGAGQGVWETDVRSGVKRQSPACMVSGGTADDKTGKYHQCKIW